MTWRAGWLLAGLAACASGGDQKDAATDAETDGVTDEAVDPTVPEQYAFAGRSGASSVAYDGQVFRHLLIRDLAAHIGGLTARIDGGLFPDDGEILSELMFYLAFDSDTSGAVSHGFAPSTAALQGTYGDVSSGKDLLGKIAGNDPAGQHRDWAVDLVGWSDPDIAGPEALVRAWAAEIDAGAVARANGDVPVGPDGRAVPAVHLTADGRDLQQLVQKFLLGAVAYSQGADDYLDDDLPGSGLLASNAALEEGKPYTALEHAWDEGFGYFGASVDYCGGDDAVIADVGWSDTVSEDGAVDLLTEVCWGHSVNAAKRDRAGLLSVDLTAESWAGFLEGRALIASADGELSADQLDALRAHRDRAVGAWELTIATSVVHYLNETLVAMRDEADETYDFAEHAKVWSEAKGFALGLQFNPRSRLSDDDFAALHAHLGDAPVLPGDPEAVTEARAGLRAARALLGEAYGLEASVLGDEDGLNGL